MQLTVLKIKLRFLISNIGTKIPREFRKNRGYSNKSSIFFLLIVIRKYGIIKKSKMQGMLTGLLGNMSLLSYFVKKRETEVVVVQTLGVVSIYAVITQLAMAKAMPLPHFVVTSVVVASCLVVNFMKYFNFLNLGVWRLWEDFITVGGLSALPQVIRLYMYLICISPM